MDNNQRYNQGLIKIEELDGEVADEKLKQLGDLGKYIIEFGFGEIYTRAGLTLCERELATIAMLTVLGGKELELRFHISAALKAGLTLEQIEEIIIQSVLYAGFPTAINAMIILKEYTKK